MTRATMNKTMCAEVQMQAPAQSMFQTGIKNTAIGSVAGICIGAATPLILGAIVGVTASGPVAGGAFAAYQGAGVVAGSVMAMVQSAIMCGTSIKTCVVGGISGAAIFSKL